MGFWTYRHPAASVDKVYASAGKTAVFPEKPGPFAPPMRRVRGSDAALVRQRRGTHAPLTLHPRHTEAPVSAILGYPRFKERRSKGARRPQQVNPYIASSTPGLGGSR